VHCPRLSDLPLPQTSKTGWPWTEESRPLPERMPGGKPWPKISIVTPSYNQCEFIEETIRSVLLQGYPDLEYIIIDGGSTDNSVEIIKKYEPWLSHWVSEKDRGQSDAINKGWERSRGEIVTYLNSDDLYTPGAVAEAVYYLEKYPTYAVVHGQSIVINNQGSGKEIIGNPFDLISSINGGNCYISQPSAFIRRICLEDVGVLNVNLHLAMDYDLWLRLSVKYPFLFVSHIWSKFRHYSGSKSSGDIPHRSEFLLLVEKLYASPNLPKELLDLRKRALAWANLYLAQKYGIMKRPLRARWYALKAFILDRDICLKPGNGLFISAVLSLNIFNRMRKVKSWIFNKQPSVRIHE
jgi:glycosyltransferase involved in cell wall biosynthesis